MIKNFLGLRLQLSGCIHAEMPYGHWIPIACIKILELEAEREAIAEHLDFTEAPILALL